MANKENKMRQEIVKFCNNLAKEQLTSNGNDFASYKLNNNEMLFTEADINFENITEHNVNVVKIDTTSTDNEIALHSSIYQKNSETNAICHTIPYNCGFLAELGVTIPPVLDDVAQIVGPSVKLAKSNKPKDVLKALKNRNCCLIKNNGIIAETRTLNECHTACLVLEKGGKCFIESYTISKPVPLGNFVSSVMHVIYKKMYSKKNQENKLEQEG